MKKTLLLFIAISMFNVCFADNVPVPNAQPFTVERLEQARAYLKDQFIGNEDAIDQILKKLRGWYTRKEVRTARRSPLIISVWGLTGYGKTSTIAAIVQALGISDSFYLHCDKISGDGQNKSGVEDLLRQIETKLTVNEKNDELGIKLPRIRKPEGVVLTLDEFQVLRSLDDKGARIERPNAAQIMEFLGNGKIRIPNPLLSELNSIKSYPSFYVRTKDWDKLSDDEKRTKIEEFARPLQELLDNTGLQVELDFSSAIVFEIWQLEDILSVMPTYDPEKVTATELHNMTKRIGVQQIKSRLRGMFRNEHIRRTGQRHIVMPALGRVEFERLAERRLADLSKRIGVRIQPTEAAMERLLNEVIIPFQGVTPVFDGIDMITDETDQLLELSNDGKDTLVLDVAEKMDHLKYVAPSGKELQIELPEYRAKIKSASLGDKDRYFMALYAAAKATVQLGLSRQLPRSVRFAHSGDVLSVSVDMPDDENQSSRLETYESSLNEIAIALAGHVALKSITGQRTALSKGDLSRATSLAKAMVGNWGMGPLPEIEITQQTQSTPEADPIAEMKALFPETDKRWFIVAEKMKHEIESAIQSMNTTSAVGPSAETQSLFVIGQDNVAPAVGARLLSVGRERAMQILERERTFFYNLALELSKTERLEKRQIESLAKAFWSDPALQKDAPKEAFDCKAALTALAAESPQLRKTPSVVNKPTPVPVVENHPPVNVPRPKTKKGDVLN